MLKYYKISTNSIEVVESEKGATPSKEEKDNQSYQRFVSHVA